MRKKEIKQKYINELKNNKKEYRLNKKNIKNNYSIEINDYNYLNSNIAINPPKRGVLEEIGNSITHGLGALMAIAGFIMLLLYSNSFSDWFAAYVYGGSMIVLFTMSSLYHAFCYGTGVKRLFRRFDYSSIYLLIGATYTPILLSYIGGVKGIVFCSIQWFIIVIGITFIGVFGPTKLKWLHMPLYLVLGWCGLLFLPYMFKDNLMLFIYILGGGVIYSLGIIPFAIDKKVSHFIWHIFVLIAAVVQWLGIFLYIYL